MSQAKTLSTILDEPIARRFWRDDKAAQANAVGCPYIRYCNQGCPQHRIASTGLPDVAGTNVFCGCTNGTGHGYSDIWRHMEVRLAHLA